MSNNLHIKRLANLVICGVPTHEICQVMQITDEQLNEIKNTEEYETVYNELLAEELEREEHFKTLNDAWDKIEASALNNIMDRMEWLSDPEFALKVAAVANKAQRRNGLHHKPIDGTVGARATIALSVNFANKLDATYDVTPREKRTVLEHKKTDVMNPSTVETLLQPKKETQQDRVNNLAQALPDLMPAE